ncbi:chemotaxis protein CheD [Pseudodesulfovibrio sp. JC047]|uniref:chemotaxis protein CheD n=1 Tax=Pseudodesulfovibrio sp. JC047 TaxID=2683199 RepID=UPI0013CFBE82|nr:chemotaxis protein CheD [Pseudodesulfovibrio sp. JC047]NDV20274.1 chemotaxis protein CheD [Pseudodesulfovibrio sp. JC047]
MSLKIVGLSDMQFSVHPEDVLITYSLGSCIGVSAYDPRTRIGGLIHCLLPAPGNHQNSETNPFKFVTTGVPAMVRSLVQAGASQHRLIYKGAGGANIRSQFHIPIGTRNATALKGVLAYNKTRLTAEEFGDDIPRTMSLHLGTGRVVIRTDGHEHDLV